ncbi:MAG: hypothetical protein HQ592_17805, partial [Planctomycetes bacterium]|nr:hypothetical protein [Planctomycetota bacterium]
MTQSREKLGGSGRWIIWLSAAFVLCLLAFAVSHRPIRATINARRLRNPETRAKAGRVLKSMGLTGRMALLGEVRSNDDRTGMFARSVLSKALRDDIKAGRDIEPVIRRAIMGMSDPGDAGRLCAAIASEGWALGLLDEKTKREIAKHLAGVIISARSEYPVGMGRPYISQRFSGPVSSALRFKYRCIGILDGREKRQTSVRPWNTIASVQFHDITAKPGRHTLQGKLELELVSIDITGPFDPSDEIGWKTTLESDVVEINVRDDLPD